MLLKELQFSPKNRTYRKWLLVCLCLGILASYCGKSQNATGSKHEQRMTPQSSIPVRPNILLLVVDTLRFDATSLADSYSKNTPFLKRLAKHAMNFRRSYSTFDSTPTSHFSMLTGYVDGLQTDIDHTNLSLPYQLKEIGYHTFGVAANGNLSKKTMPVLLGFDRYVCLQELWLDMPLSERERFYRKLDGRISSYGGRVNDFNRMFMFSSANAVIPLFKEWIQETSRPFFGFVNLIEPHDPYFPDSRFYNKEVSEKNIRPKSFDSDIRFRSLGPTLANPDAIENEQQRIKLKQRIDTVGGRSWSLSDDLTTEDLRMYRMRYEGEVREIDNHLEMFFRFLKKEKLLDSTIVIITSDHGEAFGEKGYVTHTLSNCGGREATQRVPLLIYFPKYLGIASKESTALCSIADIPPTIYDILGIDWWPLAEQTRIGNFGKSLIPFLKSPENIRYSTIAHIRSLNAIEPMAQDRFKKEAMERLRSLGYLN